MMQITRTFLPGTVGFSEMYILQIIQLMLQALASMPELVISCLRSLKRITNMHAMSTEE